MKIKELKEVIANLPDEMPVGLLDSTTDDTENMNYSLRKEDFEIDDYWSFGNDEPQGKMLYINFKNKLNDKPI